MFSCSPDGIDMSEKQFQGIFNINKTIGKSQVVILNQYEIIPEKYKIT